MRRSGMLRVEDAKTTEELQRRSIVERLMGPDGVVRLLPGAELGIERVQMPVTVGHLVELLGVSALGAFHGAIELRTPRRQDEQPDAGPLTGLFELREELGAPVDLAGADRKGHPGPDELEE